MGCWIEAHAWAWAVMSDGSSMRNVEVSCRAHMGHVAGTGAQRLPSRVAASQARKRFPLRRRRRRIPGRRSRHPLTAEVCRLQTVEPQGETGFPLCRRYRNWQRIVNNNGWSIYMLIFFNRRL